MSETDRREIQLVIHCRELPPAGWNGMADLQLGIQQGDTVIEDRSLADGERTFTVPLQIKVKPDTGEIDFGGPFTQGKKGERFVYLNWGGRDESGHWTNIRRTKLPLSRLDPGRLTAALHNGRPVEVVLRLTDAKGGPAAASLPATAMDVLP